MSNPSATPGLCSTCKYDPDCMYEAASGGAILQCEQYELAPSAQAPRRAATQARSQSNNATDTNGYAGLCANCENRKTCIYPKPEGGVWHCDEYI